MAALANELPSINADHVYDAKAYVFSAEFQQPILRTVTKQSPVELPKAGGYRYERAEPFRLDGIVSYRGGYSQVAGHRGCNRPAATTVATSVIEDLNLLDVLTADRVVAQITTEHPNGGRVPSVSFLGTRFENLRIAGQQVEIEPHLDILEPKPDDDESYFNDGGVFSRIAHQYANIKRMIGLPKWASDQFNWDPAGAQRQNQMNCSLVSEVAGVSGQVVWPRDRRATLRQDLPRRTYREARASERRTRLETAETEEYKYRFQLTMVRAELDCPACRDRPLLLCGSKRHWQWGRKYRRPRLGRP